MNGLQRAGYTLATAGRPQDKRDLLVVWNRDGATDQEASDWEAHGGTVVVCENGYLGKDANGLQFYAMSVHGHNGSGWFPVGEEDRFKALNVELKPWASAAAGHLLVCAQRGIGSRTMASPRNWDSKTANTLMAMGHRKIKVRKHPGQVKPTTTLVEDLAGARACVIWSSASGVLALTLGIPVIYTAPHWIASEGGARGLACIDALVLDDERRHRAMHRMAWGQRSVDEIQSGEPFVTFRERLGEAKW